jgi:hypothetical protein
MAFKDQFKKVANDTVNSVGKFASNVTESSKKIAEKTKLKHKISTEESIINGIYLTIGKLCYENDGNIGVEAYKEHFDNINAHLAEIESLNARIAAIDGSGICQSCGEKIQSDSKFCSNCGAVNPSYTEPTADEENADEAPAEPVADESDADVYVDIDSEDEN